MRRPMTPPAPRTRATAALAALLLALGCREAGPERMVPGGAPGDEPAVLRTSDLSAGGARPDIAAVNPYADDAQAVADGRALYGAMNCAGCHGGAGGGGIGPPLADDQWIYGGQPENIVEAILKGRPNGMPSFGAKLPPAEAWKIAAFVATLAKPTAAEGREPPAGARAQGASTQAP